MRIKRLLLSAMALLVTLPVTSYAAAYIDIAGHKDEGYITEYSAYGLVSGYTDGTFLPDAKLTRAEVTALINQLQLPTIRQKNEIFSDVLASEWYYTSVQNAVKSGLMSGYADKTFQPQKNISRYEAISIVSRMIKSDAALPVPYTDKERIPSWASDAVKKLYTAGIIADYDGNTLNGNTPITRAEMIRMLDKMMRGYDFDTTKIRMINQTASVGREESANVANSKFPHDVLGYLTIESIGIKKYPVKDGADLATIKTALGHFAESPFWNGNVAFCAHNRDYKYDFRNLKKISKGDEVIYETRFGKRKYTVSIIKPINETDWSDIITKDETNKVTMVTCIESQPTKRLLVQANEKI